MVLTTAKIETIVKEEVRMQYLGFQISPPNATLWVNDDIWELEPDGTATQFLNFGTYSYRVQAPNYHPDAGKVTLNNANKTEIVSVNLKPNFGWVEVAGDGPLKDASVYVDDNFIGKAPCKSEALKSGQHTLRVVKKMYATYSQTVMVADNETIRVAPNLTADFAEVTLKVDADADIYVNDERKGTRSWTGPLGSGTYKIECKQPNHETSQITKEITASMAGQTLTLPAPKPIYGSLNVESSPNFCQLFIDGKAQGNTPQFIPEILVGSHEIKLTKEGYADHMEMVTIVKGERTQMKPTMSNGREVQFTCNVPNATLEIDGQRVNSASGTYMLTYGSHSIRATAAEYLDYSATINVSGNTRTYGITMQPLRKDEKTITVNGVSFTMKLVEGGTFQMGATKEQESDAASDEKPVHSVTLSDYYLGETEVTQALWEAVMGTTVSQQRDKADKSWSLRGEGGDYPMYYVSWNECQEFITKLNRLTGKNFRLPTEAEWEYAARGGTKSKGYKYAGSSTLRDVAWFGQWIGKTYDNGNSGEKTHAVKTKSPNELGLYDMSGNVWEWCQDWYGSYNSSSQTNPQGPSSGSFRVLRGGCWSNNAWGCRVSDRFLDYPGKRNGGNGFRLCLPQ